GLSDAEVAALTSSDEVDGEDPLDELRYDLAAGAVDRLPVYEGPSWRAVRRPSHQVERLAASQEWGEDDFLDVYATQREAMHNVTGPADGQTVLVRIP